MCWTLQNFRNIYIFVSNDNASFYQTVKAWWKQAWSRKLLQNSQSAVVQCVSITCVRLLEQKASFPYQNRGEIMPKKIWTPLWIRYPQQMHVNWLNNTSLSTIGILYTTMTSYHLVTGKIWSFWDHLPFICWRLPRVKN